MLSSIILLAFWIGMYIYMKDKLIKINKKGYNKLSAWTKFRIFAGTPYLFWDVLEMSIRSRK